MNQLRTAGCLEYSRTGIAVHRGRLAEWSRQRITPLRLADRCAA
jgi:hypothetical protein